MSALMTSSLGRPTYRSASLPPDCLVVPLPVRVCVVCVCVVRVNGWDVSE